MAAADPPTAPKPWHARPARHRRPPTTHPSAAGQGHLRHDAQDRPDHRDQPRGRTRLRRRPPPGRARPPRDPHRARPRRARAADPQLRQEGHAVTTLPLDLADRASIDAAADRLTRECGHLDVLVNNAGTMPDFGTLSALDADTDQVRAAMEVSLLGTWALTQALLPLLTAAPVARIVNVSSLCAQQIAAGLDLGAPLRSPAHSMAKYTLNALTAVLGRALADTRILVNAVDPGNIATHPERGDDDNDRSAAESALDIVWAATLGPDGPTGGLFRHGRPVA
ncbi:SDR family oxidoreductase [Streptomyces sp. NPDC046976]|uniref:SDR family oxidoreductase n=1 Tax=Streptomyces sp. NPDC046976 TaxID=3155258 RepID=UPI0034034BD2